MTTNEAAYGAMVSLTKLCVYRFDQIEARLNSIEAKIDRPLLDPTTMNTASLAQKTLQAVEALGLRLAALEEALKEKQASDAFTIQSALKIAELAIATHPKINESFIDDLRRTGVLVRCRAGVQMPPGYSQIIGPLGRISYIDPKTEMVTTWGHWFALTPAANLINKHLIR